MKEKAKVIPKQFDRFGSLLEFVTRVEKINPSDKWPKPPTEASDKADEGFSLTKNRAAALKLAREGWTDGLKQIKQALLEIDAPPQVLPEPWQDVSGEIFNLDAVLQGQPEDMICYLPQESTKPRVIRIAFDFGHSANVDTQDIIDRGAAIASAVNDIEAANIRVELVAYAVMAPGSGSSGGRSSTPKTFTSITIKEPDAHLDMERLVFVCAHPSFLRRLYFRYCEGMPDFWARCGSGYGTPQTATEKDFEKLVGNGPTIKVDLSESTAKRVGASIKAQLETICNP